jgi:hypothetical protein
MKKLYTLFLLFTIVNTFSQNILITSLTSESVVGGINVNLQTVSGTGSGYLIHNYTINGDVINLSVCYWFDNTLPILTFNHNFFIPLVNTGNYTLNCQTVLSSSQTVCNNFAITDNRTISATYLNTNSYDLQSEQLVFYPNPSNGIVEFKEINEKINQIFVYDITGKIVKQITETLQNKIDLNELINGVFLLKIETENRVFSQKIVIKK